MASSDGACVVDGKLWIKLTSPDPAKGLGSDVLAQRFRRIFDNVRNYSRRGVSFAKVVQQVDKLHFSSETDVIVLSEIYEDLLKRVAAEFDSIEVGEIRPGA